MTNQTQSPNIQSPNITSAIKSATTSAQSAIANTEHSALTAVARFEDAMKSVTGSFDTVKTVGAELVQVVDNAGRTTLGGVVAMNGSLATYGRELLDDTIAVGRKTIELRSLTDAVELHTAFAERRINAVFHTMAAMNTLTQTNVMAMWTPFAELVRSAGSKTAAETAKVEKTLFKNAA